MMSFFDPPTEPCPVCSNTIEDDHFAECQRCGHAFHMRMTEDAPERKDCGAVYIDGDSWSMSFACDTCFEDGLNAGASIER